jgi:hypothetical protein
VQQKQTRDAEVGVEDVRHVARAVRDAAVVLVLALGDEVRQLVAVDPGRLKAGKVVSLDVNTKAHSVGEQIPARINTRLVTYPS